MEAGVGVSVEGGAGVEMMVMDSLDPTLLQMKTEVSSLCVCLTQVAIFQISMYKTQKLPVSVCVFIQYFGFEGNRCCSSRDVSYSGCGWRSRGCCSPSNCDNSGPESNHHPTGKCSFET